MEDEERERDVIFAVVATVILFLMALFRTSADDEDRRNSAENIGFSIY